MRSIQQCRPVQFVCLFVHTDRLITIPPPSPPFPIIRRVNVQTYASIFMEYHFTPHIHVHIFYALDLHFYVPPSVFKMAFYSSLLNIPNKFSHQFPKAAHRGITITWTNPIFFSWIYQVYCQKAEKKTSIPCQVSLRIIYCYTNIRGVKYSEILISIT